MGLVAWSWEPVRLLGISSLFLFSPNRDSCFSFFFFLLYYHRGSSYGARSSDQGKMEHTLSIAEELIRSPRATVVSLPPFSFCLRLWSAVRSRKKDETFLNVFNYLTLADRSRADVTGDANRSDDFWRSDKSPGVPGTGRSATLLPAFIMVPPFSFRALADSLPWARSATQTYGRQLFPAIVDRGR